MSYRAYHDDDDDRDVITCVTPSDTRPVARKEHTCGAVRRPSRWGAPPPPVHARRRRVVAREDVPRRRVLPTLMAKPQGFAR
jgi:hypothetical protein